MEILDIVGVCNKGMTSDPLPP